SEYLYDLNMEIEKLEKESKKDSSKKGELSRMRKDLSETKERLVTIINFEGKVLAFLDQPQPELLKNLLSVMSHDSYYIETTFTEGEGVKYTRHVVFRGFPTFIFAVSKDSFLNWKDIETRFEVREPNMSPGKYLAAIKLSVKEMFGTGEPGSEESRSIREDIKRLIDRVRDDQQSGKLAFLVPLDERKIVETLFGNEVRHGDAMRKIPRILNHIRANAIWNYNNRVKLLGPGNEYVLVHAEDIRSLVDIYDELELSSILSGIPASLYEFWRDVLTPMFVLGEDGEYATVRQSDIVKALEEYCAANSGKTRLRPGKLIVSRNLTKLEERGLIKRVEDDKDKRGRKIITLVDPEEFVVPLNTRIDELIKKISITMENGRDTILYELLNKDYSAFLERKKLVSQGIEISFEDGKQLTDEKWKSAIIQGLIKEIAELSGYSPNIRGSVDTNLDTNLNVAPAFKIFDVPFHDSPSVFHYTGPAQVIGIIQEGSGIEGTYELDLRTEEILTVPKSVAMSLKDADLGKIIDGGSENE
ncbi:MAG: hypothetical protein ACP5UZ_08110, partial [Thermoplasmata archaeon]